MGAFGYGVARLPTCCTSECNEGGIGTKVEMGMSSYLLLFSAGMWMGSKAASAASKESRRVFTDPVDEMRDAM